MGFSRFVVGVVGVLAFAAPPALAAEIESPLDWRLAELAGKELRNAPASEQADAVSLLEHGAGSLLRYGDELVVEVRVSGSMAGEATALEAAGAKVLNRSGASDTITVAVDEGELRALAAVTRVESASAQITPMSGSIDGGDEGGGGAINGCATGVVSEGDAQLRAGQARTQFDVDGTGVEVGILSDTFDTRPTGIDAANDVASGDLPGVGNPCGRTVPVDVVQDTSACGSGCSDEGRAMLQIVHDLAPGASLSFATALFGQQAYADNIRALANNGADVIADDFIYFNEPVYQDGPIAQAINDVTAQGVAYFTMAFNNNGSGASSWEAPGGYRATTCPAAVLADRAGGADSCMDFDPGVGVDPTLDVNVLGGAPFRLSLAWAEAKFGISDDFDVYVFDGATISGKDVADNLATQDPTGFLSFTTGAAGTRQIVIRRYAGAGTPRLKLVSNDNGAATISSFAQTISPPDVTGPTIYGHNGAANAQTVGAIPFNNANVVESFSSRGPVTHLFAPVIGTTPAAALGSPEVLDKPDVAATDGTLNTFFGPANRFFGTSAAAPHAAAVAALQLEANPSLTQALVKANQRTTAVALPGFGVNIGGAGRLDAVGAIAAAPPPAPRVSALTGGGATTKAPPAIGFAVTGDAKTITCAVDGDPAVPCTSPFTPGVGAGGDHTVVVTATDYFGQSGSNSTGFATDSSTKLKIAKGPKKKTTKAKAKFTLSAEAGAKLECKLDKGGFKSCRAKPRFKVKPGKHKLTVRATDAVSNVATVSYSWKVK